MVQNKWVTYWRWVGHGCKRWGSSGMQLSHEVCVVLNAIKRSAVTRHWKPDGWPFASRFFV